MLGTILPINLLLLEVMVQPNNFFGGGSVLNLLWVEGDELVVEVD